MQIAIGVKKEVDFPTWYTNVLTKADMIDYYNVSGCYILRPWSYSIWEIIQGLSRHSRAQHGTDLMPRVVQREDSGDGCPEHLLPHVRFVQSARTRKGSR